MSAEALNPDDLAEPDHATLYTSISDFRLEAGQEQWALIRYVGEPIGEVIPLAQERVNLGRASDCDLQLPEPEVSRNHAVILVHLGEGEPQRVQIMDLGSTNGTFVNGHRIELPHEPQPLNHGDVLRVGAHAFKLKHLDPVERHYHEAMLAQTTMDSLCGVSNRATVLSSLAKLSDLARRHRRPLSLILCDLDHFKQINDHWGHAAGDEVLRFFGALMLGRLRACDQVGRIGGEEFLIVLPETALKEAVNVAESLRKSLNVAEIPLEGTSETVRLTCCFGVAQLSDRDSDGGSLMARADVALYHAKGAGRNRVEFDDLP